MFSDVFQANRWKTHRTIQWFGPRGWMNNTGTLRHARHHDFSLNSQWVHPGKVHDPMIIHWLSVGSSMDIPAYHKKGIRIHQDVQYFPEFYPEFDDDPIFACVDLIGCSDAGTVTWRNSESPVFHHWSLLFAIVSTIIVLTLIIIVSITISLLPFLPIKDQGIVGE